MKGKTVTEMIKEFDGETIELLKNLEYFQIQIMHPKDVLNIIHKLSKELSDEREKPKIWDDVPENVDFAYVQFYKLPKTTDGFEICGKEYTRELPKSIEQKIAEKIASDHDKQQDSYTRINTEKACLAAIEEYKKQTEVKK